jgi:hypothetical protein
MLLPCVAGVECQGHSTVVDMVELQQDGQIPIAELETMVDEKEDRNDFVDDKLSSGAFGCYQKIHMTPSSWPPCAYDTRLPKKGQY